MVPQVCSQDYRIMMDGLPDVVVLCGGLGTRIRRAIGDKQKAMARIADRPFVEILIEYVATFGFSRFILGVGYQAEAVESYFAGRDFPWQIDFSRESSPLGTGGALRNARSLIRTSDAVVMNGDSFCAVDFAEMIKTHRSNKAGATVAVCRVQEAGEYGRVVFDGRGAIGAFDEKRPGPGEAWVNSGIYLFQRRVVDALSAQVPLSLEHDVFPSLVGHSLFACCTTGRLFDIGTPERYQVAQRELLKAVAAVAGRR
jgi:D-glycero-alpha-D-manno-heptose 1-phosphate guanylyltransferase